MPPRTPIIVSLSTVPFRLARLPDTVANIHAALPTAAIVINIPHVLTRTGEPYGIVEPSLAALPYVVVQRCEDIGPITKVLPTFALTRHLLDAVVLSIDDDINYSAEYLYWLLDAWFENRAARPELVMAGMYTTIYVVSVVEGFAGIVYPRRAITDDMMRDMLASTLMCKSCFTTDDLVISTVLRNHGVLMCSPAGSRSRVHQLIRDSRSGHSDAAALCNVQNNSVAYAACHRDITSSRGTSALECEIAESQYTRFLDSGAPELISKLDAWLATDMRKTPCCSLHSL